MSMPVRRLGNLLSMNCNSNRVNARMECRIQLSPTSGVLILPLGRVVASGNKLLYETRRRTIMPEEVTDINIPMEPLHYPIFAMVVEQLLPMREVSADRQICATEAAMNTQARI